MIYKTNEEWEEIKKEYQALEPFPEYPYDMNWVMKLQPFENFIKFGAETWQLYQELQEEFKARFREWHPKLFDLLKKVWGE